MSLYNIAIQFPNHYINSQVEVDDDSIGLIKNKKENGLVTTFHDPGTVDPCSPELRPLFNMLADFYDFGAKYFEAGKVSGEDVAAKMSQQLGEIWLSNRAKSQFSYHFIGVWPHSVNFGELCYSSDPSVNIEVTWKYKRMELCNAICPTSLADTPDPAAYNHDNHLSPNMPPPSNK